MSTQASARSPPAMRDQDRCKALMADPIGSCNDRLSRSAAVSACVVLKIAPGYPKVFCLSVQTLLQLHEGPR
jgi:hypothetical protein